MKLDPGKLTFAEIIEIEEKGGVEFSSVFAGPPPVKALAAIVWVMKRREQPDLSWEDALNFELSTADALFEPEVSTNGDGPSVDPTPLPVESAGST
jgi:hypothetical protein